MGRISVEVELTNSEDLVRVKDGARAPDRDGSLRRSLSNPSAPLL
jgi:hypothetical protein